MKIPLLATLLVLSMTGTALAAVKEEPVTYKDGETTMKGFVVYDDAKTGKRPGIVIVHEWWGITKHIHAEAQRMASLGWLTGESIRTTLPASSGLCRTRSTRVNPSSPGMCASARTRAKGSPS